MTIRIKYDDQLGDVLVDVNNELEKKGIPIRFESDEQLHDGYELYEMVSTLPEGVREFRMLMEPYQPENPDRACFECVLQHDPMCIDRSYCEFKETGKTWRKYIKKEEDEEDN